MDINTFNIKCAKFLDYKNNGMVNLEHWIRFENDQGIDNNSLKFDRDWNDIMKVKTKICQLDVIDEFNTSYDSVAKGWRCAILPAYNNTFDYIYSQVFETELEAHIAVINKFLDWYLTNK